MDQSNLETLTQFDEHTLPDLDVAVLGALELFADTELPSVDLSSCSHPLVLGSGNAEVTGRMLFEDQDALYASESNYERVLRKARSEVESAVIISASGGKHAVEMARVMKEKGLETWLYTNNPDPKAGEHVPEDHVLIFPKNREPYTYNTSTYMGMLMGHTGENPEKLHEFITENVMSVIPEDLSSYHAFYFILPPEVIMVRNMLLTKFHELFGACVSGRVFTHEESKHAKTVVPSEKECFVSFGVENNDFGTESRRVHIPLPEGVGYVGMMAIGYYVIGHIQKQHPPYFKEHVGEYVRKASELFDQEIAVIVE